jgi:hypothetical protein
MMHKLVVRSTVGFSSLMALLTSISAGLVRSTVGFSSLMALLKLISAGLVRSTVGFSSLMALLKLISAGMVRSTVGFSSLIALLNSISAETWLNSISADKHNGDNFGSSWIALSKNPQRDSISLLFLFDGREQILGFQNRFTIDMRDKITQEKGSIYILSKRLQSRQHGRAVGENFTDQTSFEWKS